MSSLEAACLEKGFHCLAIVPSDNDRRVRLMEFFLPRVNFKGTGGEVMFFSTLIYTLGL